MTEKFRKTWRGEVRSSEGYSIRILGRTGLQYKQGNVNLRLNSEAMAGPGVTIVLYATSIPDGPELDRFKTIANIQRAFLFAGWHLMIQE